MITLLVFAVIGLLILVALLSYGWWQNENAAREWKTKCEWWREFALADPQGPPGSIQELVRGAMEFGTANAGNEEFMITVDHVPSAGYNSVTVEDEPDEDQDRCDP